MFDLMTRANSLHTADIGKRYPFNRRHRVNLEDHMHVWSELSLNQQLRHEKLPNHAESRSIKLHYIN